MKLDIIGARLCHKQGGSSNTAILLLLNGHTHPQIKTHLFTRNCACLVAAVVVVVVVVVANKLRYG